MIASHCAPARYEVDDENNQRDHKQQMNQATRNMQAKSQQPEDYENHDNRPKHSYLPLLSGTPGKTAVMPGVWVSEFWLFVSIYFAAACTFASCTA
jgi:hypothetical protein